MRAPGAPAAPKGAACLAEAAALLRGAKGGRAQAALLAAFAFEFSIPFFAVGSYFITKKATNKPPARACVAEARGACRPSSLEHFLAPAGSAGMPSWPVPAAGIFAPYGAFGNGATTCARRTGFRAGKGAWREVRCRAGTEGTALPFCCFGRCCAALFCMQRGLHPLIGKHLRNWHRSFYRSFYMQSHRLYSSTKGRDDERAAARRETKQSLKLLS